MTQFEAAIAAPSSRSPRPGSRSAVIEAGLGGRLDATNVIPSRVTVLTSIGLDHTEWLGETEAEIAAEKLAVLRDGSVLVARAGQPGGRGAAEAPRRARWRATACARRRIPGRMSSLRAARRLPAAQLRARDGRGRGVPRASSTRARSRRVAAERRGPGAPRGDRRASPPTFVDAAHNPDGARRWPRRCRSSPAGGRSSPASRSSPTRTRRRWSRPLAPAVDARRLHRAAGRGAARDGAPGARPHRRRRAGRALRGRRRARRRRSPSSPRRLGARSRAARSAALAASPAPTTCRRRSRAGSALPS